MKIKKSIPILSAMICLSTLVGCGENNQMEIKTSSNATEPKDSSVITEEQTQNENFEAVNTESENPSGYATPEEAINEYLKFYTDTDYKVYDSLLDETHKIVLSEKYGVSKDDLIYDFLIAMHEEVNYEIIEYELYDNYSKEIYELEINSYINKCKKEDTQPEDISYEYYTGGERTFEESTRLYLIDDFSAEDVVIPKVIYIKGIEDGENIEKFIRPIVYKFNDKWYIWDIYNMLDKFYS